MNDCLFCKIVAGEIPSTKIFENEFVYAFADIDPQAPFHAVVVPKTHIKCASDINSENCFLVGEIFKAIAVIAKENGLDEGYRVVNNCGKMGGQTVDHLHFHLLGRRYLQWPPG